MNLPFHEKSFRLWLFVCVFSGMNDVIVPLIFVTGWLDKVGIWSEAAWVFNLRGPNEKNDIPAAAGFPVVCGGDGFDGAGYDYGLQRKSIYGRRQ